MQTLLVPLIVPGCCGTVVTFTVIDRVILLPQLLFAKTELVPFDVPGITDMLFVAELPIHPPGKLQV